MLFFQFLSVSCSLSSHCYFEIFFFGFCVVCRVFMQEKTVCVCVCMLRQMGIQAVTFRLSLSPHRHTHMYTIIVALDLSRTAFPPKNYRYARGSIGSIDMTTHFNAVISRFSIHFFSFLCIYTYCCMFTLHVLFFYSIYSCSFCLVLRFLSLVCF